MVKVGYVGHSWGCHPETCSCREYAVITEDGKKVIGTYYHKEDAESAAKAINSLK